MHTRGWSGARWALAACMLGPLACESTRTAGSPEPSISPARERARQVASARLASAETRPAEGAPAIPARPVFPDGADETAAAVDQIIRQIPGPEMETERLNQVLADPATSAQDRAEISRTLERLASIARPNRIRLGLTEAIRRALQHSYAIQVQSYNPAIETTRIVEAEAQFDAVFFANFTNNKQDRPTASQLQGTQSETRTFEAGVRKLLSTGTQVQTSYNLARTETNLGFQTLNPAYFNQFIVEFRQPFLRGFGLDFNRSQIEVARLNRAISIERLRRAIRETIYNVEQAYWRLAQARVNVTVSARLLSSLETILNSLEQRARIGYDVYAVQLDQTRSRIEQRQVEFIQRQNNVKDAEDALKRLINDPALSQAADLEIIPADLPTIEPVVLDLLGEVTAGLTHREELHEAKLSIEQAQIAIGVAKNQALPRLDALFRYIVDGLGGTPHAAFSQLSENDFHEYVIGLEFEWPIGARAGEAAIRRARLQQAQAIAAHRDQIEGVINDVKVAIRDIRTKYDQIGPSLRAARASENWLAATKARQERRDPPNLQVELDAEAALANSRQALVQFIADYNIALINLERQKGTLLSFNNIVIRGVDEQKYLEPYRPLCEQ